MNPINISLLIANITTSAAIGMYGKRKGWNLTKCMLLSFVPGTFYVILSELLK